jgi:hypothetical protein
MGMRPTGAHLAPLLSALSSHLWGERAITASPSQSQIIILIEALKTLGYRPSMQVCTTPYFDIEALYGIELEPCALFVSDLHPNWDHAIDHYLWGRNYSATMQPSKIAKVEVDPTFIFNLPFKQMDEVLTDVQRARELILDISGAQLEANTEKVLGNKKMHRL